jgi:hypothetical protein
MSHTTTTTTETLEELGSNEALGVEVELTWNVYPEEPMVMYYPDGSGYPGSPAHAELVGCEVTAAWGDGWMANRRGPSCPHVQVIQDGERLINAPDWLDFLLPKIESIVEKSDEYAYNALEQAGEEEESAREYASERRWEARRLEK